jgi:hypothetical protein
LSAEKLERRITVAHVLSEADYWLSLVVDEQEDQIRVEPPRMSQAKTHH